MKNCFSSGQLHGAGQPDANGDAERAGDATWGARHVPPHRDAPPQLQRWTPRQHGLPWHVPPEVHLFLFLYL